MSARQIQSWLQQGLGHHRAGRLNDAADFYRRALALAPRNFDAMQLAGLIAYQQRRLPEAIDLLGRANQAAPRDHVCEMRYALALLANGQAALAEKHFRHAVEVRPDFADGWENLAYCLKLQDRLVDAVGCHEKATALRPQHAPAWAGQGLALSLVGRYAEALACHDKALALDARCATALLGRAQALHQSHRMPEAVVAYDRFLAVEPRHLEAHSNRLYALHSLETISRETLFAEHVAYGRLVAPPGATPPWPERSVEPARRLRVAFLSPDLRSHSVAYFLEALLTRLPRSEFELFLYHDHFREDAVSARLKTLASVWRNFSGQPAAVVEKTIRTDAPDVLFDLAGHTGINNRLPLFARRLAPVQINYLGYPNTTGVAAMDYRFTDAFVDPLGEADALATEKLIRFAPTAWTYSPPADAPVVAPLPSLTQAGVTFGCFNAPAKITDAMLARWAQILKRVGGSRLCLKGSGFGDPAVRQRYLDQLCAGGASASAIIFLERTADTRSHLACYHGIDIALDTAPYHGTTTTCEALWMGVPVITLPGDRHVARVGASLLHAVGHAEWIATDGDDYVRRALELAGNLPHLAVTRAGLRADLQRSALLDHAGQAVRFATAIRECWQTWCASQVSDRRAATIQAAPAAVSA